MYRRWRIGAYYVPILLTVSLGLLNIVSAAGGAHRRDHLIAALLISKSVSLISRGLVLVFGFFLLLLGEGLLRRSRTAWKIALVLSAVSALAHLSRGVRLIDAAFSLIVFVSLLLSGSFYRRPNDRVTVRRGLQIVFACWLAMLAYGMLSFHFLGRAEFGQRFGFDSSLDHVLRLYVLFDDSGLNPRTVFAHIFINTVYLVAIFGWLLLAASLILPAYEYRQRLAGDQATAKKLVKKYGQNSLEPYKLGDDKRYHFTAERTAFLAYKEIGHSAIVLGDPVGKDGESIIEAIRSFQHYADTKGMRTAYMQVTEANADCYVEAGYKLLKVGEEAIIQLEHVSMEGKAMKNFRTALRKLERDGYSVKHYLPPLSTSLVRRLMEVEDEWKTLPGRQERAFSQSACTPELLKRSPVAATEDVDGNIVAFISLHIDYAPKAIALDLLRRRRQIPNGAVDALIITTATEYKARGYLAFSLGLAPFSGVGEGKAGLSEKTIKLVYENLNGVFSFQGLREFKEKFGPIWEPRFFAYRYAYQLPALSYAVLQASKPSLSGGDKLHFLKRYVRGKA